MSDKQKIAVLGGGVGSMVAAFALTEPEVRDRYEVTVYQMGWRIGGKGASGRAEGSGRIEEHGLHIWMGFYENAFRVMRACYEELGRPGGKPLARWDDAFKPHSYIVLEEQLDDGSWHPWEFDFPTNMERPGDGGLILPDIWANLGRIVSWMGETWTVGFSMHGEAGGGLLDNLLTFHASVPEPTPKQTMPDWVAQEHKRAVEASPDPTRFIAFGAEQPTYLGWALDMIGSLSPDPAQHSAAAHNAIVWLIQAFMGFARTMLGGLVGTEMWARKLWVEVNLAGSAAIGILRDGVLFGGWSAIDHLDWTDWLVRNGADDVTARSAPVRGIYDLVFGFVGGDTKRGRLAAGVAMYGILRMLLTYRGAIFWEMQAGMGDTVFGPFYEVLRRRGVRFEFFHRVADLHLDADRRNVSAIDLVRQVELKGDTYEPLVDVADLPCWPSGPLYDQIEGGDDLRASGINHESAWALPWRDEKPRRLELGRDFDQVVLGISIAGVRHVARELAAASPAFATMLEQVQTVQTFGWQLWLAPDLDGLGWRKGLPTSEAPVLTAFSEPIDTWGDLSHLLVRETWDPARAPRSIAYLCGSFGDAASIPPPFTGDPRWAGFPGEELARFRGIAVGFLDSDARALWPRAVDGAGRFDRGLVVSEFAKVNIDPTERYVLSVPGTTRFRLAPGASGFANLVLAGDWTENVINASCVEAAVISGLRAARAITGQSIAIAGEP